VAESLAFLTSGYRVNVDDILGRAVFEERYDELVVVRDISFYSLCEHHLLPFFGLAHVGYLPQGRIIGLSKLPRLVDAFARRLQVQERLTSEIADALQRHLEPRGVAVVLEADHLCSMMRGVQKPGNRTITSSMTGIFRRDPRTRGEFMSLIRGR
jgi:GTP cyclohydrolase I